MISHYTNPGQTNWSRFLLPVTYAYNVAYGGSGGILRVAVCSENIAVVLIFFRDHPQLARFKIDSLLFEIPIRIESF